MRVLLIGECYSTNLGDGIIFQNVSYLLLKYFEGIELIDVLDISGKTCYMKTAQVFYKKNKLKKIVNRWSPAMLKEILSLKKRTLPTYMLEERYDLAIYVGGQLISPYFLKQLETINNELKKQHIPIAYNAIGVGKFHNKGLQSRMVTLLNDKRSTYLSVRDGKKNLQAAGVLKPIKTVCDNAIFTNEVFEIKKKPSNVVGLGTMYIESEKKVLIAFWRFILMLLDKKGVKWQFFVNGSDEDYLFAKEILTLHGYPATTQYIKSKPETPKKLVETIASFEKIISFRLHSHIIAYSLEIPSVAMVWDDKVRSFFEMIGYPERCYDYHHYDSSLLLYTLDSLVYTEKDQERKRDLKATILQNLENLLRSQS
ncbi:polysaccharide pyruvyl transferase family protein [Enterococcus faecalis]|nr:polysaccharide pyruvyl transferase family protein [Enterococcus faecalis]